MSTQIRYKGEVVTTFNKGTITLHTDDSSLDGDIEIASTGDGGSSEEPILVSRRITKNDTYYASEDEADGYSSVIVEVPMPIIIDASGIPITENGTYDASDYGVDGVSKIVVAVPTGGGGKYSIAHYGLKVNFENREG